MSNPYECLDDTPLDADGSMLMEEWALIQLMNDGWIVVFCLSDGIRVRMLASDIFAWACADFEEVQSEEELTALWKAWHADNKYGPIKWVCQKRQQKPQPALEREMIDAGVWDDAMMALPPNTMDAETKALFASLGAGTVAP